MFIQLQCLFPTSSGPSMVPVYFALFSSINSIWGFLISATPPTVPTLTLRIVGVYFSGSRWWFGSRPEPWHLMLRTKLIFVQLQNMSIYTSDGTCGRSSFCGSKVLMIHSKSRASQPAKVFSLARPEILIKTSPKKFRIGHAGCKNELKSKP